MHVDPPNPALPDADGLNVGIVVSRYHHEVTDRLCAAAVEVFTDAGGHPDALTIVPASGAFELTILSRALAGRRCDGVVALGCIIRGETSHDQHLASAVAQGLTQVSVETGVPVGFGVLTCNTLLQARQRARERAGGGEGNKGAEAMTALLETIHTLRSLATGQPASGHKTGAGASSEGR